MVGPDLRVYGGRRAHPGERKGAAFLRELEVIISGVEGERR
jgi:hypothetical protein